MPPLSQRLFGNNRIFLNCRALAERKQNAPKKSHPSLGKTSYFLAADVLQCAPLPACVDMTPEYVRMQRNALLAHYYPTCIFV